MKREGRQRGMVRTYRILPSPWNPRPESRSVQQFDSPPTAGLFTKVPVKPTNHSKFTGRCGRARCLGCHMHPTCKSKDKSKGSHKLMNSSEMVTSHRLITWRVVDTRHDGFKDYGFSASTILDHLSNHHDDYDYDDDDDDDDDDGEDDDDEYVNDGFKANSQSIREMENYDCEIEENIVVHNKDDDDGVCVDVDVDYDYDHDHDHDDVKFVLDKDLEEDGWCLVGGI